MSLGAKKLHHEYVVVVYLPILLFWLKLLPMIYQHIVYIFAKYIACT